MYDPFAGAFGGAGCVGPGLIATARLFFVAMTPFCFFIGCVDIELVFANFPFGLLSMASPAFRLTPLLTEPGAVVGLIFASVGLFGRVGACNDGATGVSTPREVIISVNALMLFGSVVMQVCVFHDEIRLTSRD